MFFIKNFVKIFSINKKYSRTNIFYKISKFYNHEGTLISWYCDIIDYTYDPDSDTYVVTDLLADVILYPDGFVKVVDLDELAEAFEKRLLSEELLKKALRQTNQLLT